MKSTTSASSFSQGPMFMIIGNSGESAGKWQLKDITADGMDMTGDFIQFLSEDDASSYMQAVYIGDSEVDIATAINSGLPPYIVTWGFRDEEFLRENGAEIIVNSAEELFALLAEK